eukprot:gnl/MRDRNA2_/MRDRNA2_76678_c0_seq1.p1 gnl/MRDRNA2_/MRDRNA2_76678_c0~~gnl/MRDRNA2_/MRDRNA2_76678_c0_seq1.p1  ORF type:complete len:408 (+),score=70.34 gnl/MRDRNA2_/MRDRNA2_76678_c0_seq1:301-1524(+)
MRRNGRLSEVAAVLFFAHVCEALIYLHGKGIIHRDVKPENVLLTTDLPLQAKVTDFGCSAKVTAEEPERRTICGTMDYLAPEMICMEPHDHTVDIWAVGVLLYEMLVADPPFAAASQNEALKRISDADLRCPAFVTQGAEDLLRALLRRERTLRLPLPDALTHWWTSKRMNESRLSSTNDASKNCRGVDQHQETLAPDSTQVVGKGPRSRLRSLTPERCSLGSESSVSPAKKSGVLLGSESSASPANTSGYHTPYNSKRAPPPQEKIKPLLSWSLSPEQADSLEDSFFPDHGSSRGSREQYSKAMTAIEDPAHVLDEVSDTVRWMSGSIEVTQSQPDAQRQESPSPAQQVSPKERFLQCRVDDLLQQARGIVAAPTEKVEAPILAHGDEIARIPLPSHRVSKGTSAQ